MYQVSFVILHYLAFETTCSCINSIYQNIEQSNHIHYNIIVVDNASPNNSYQRLFAAFSNHPDIHFLQAPDNLGFAKGNNIGYLYAINKLNSDFVIVTNNDTEFQQKDFLKIMIQTYNQHNYALIGPDILNINGYHQNPYRTHPITDRELSRWIRNRYLWLLFLKANQLLKITKRSTFFYNYYKKRANSGRPETTWTQSADNIVLQGACIIFTPSFIACFPNYAFFPDTYMYCEEDILVYLCQKKNLKTFYTPDLRIIHNESISTNQSYRTVHEKDLFLTQNILKSLKVFKKLRKKEKLF